MLFSTFCTYLEKLENTTKRLEMMGILAELISKLELKEADIAMYLSLGYLKAPFENEKFNIADKMMQRAMQFAFNITSETIDKLYAKHGDLGDACLELTGKKTASNIELLTIHDLLLDIAIVSGTGSQDIKLKKIASLLAKLDGISSKYVVKIVLGTTRLGFTELTIIEALAKSINGTKEIKAQIEYKYSIHPDIGLIVKKIKQKGIRGIEEISIQPGVPILAQKAQRLPSTKEIIEKMGTVWAEYKFDGTRVQLHLDKNQTVKTSELEKKSLFAVEDKRVLIKTFTRNLEETTHQYPDIVEAAIKQIKATSIILDGEAIGYDADTGEFLPFQEIMQRKRKHNIKEMMDKIPLTYYVFDILYLNGKPLTKEPLRKRKEYLKKAIGAGTVIMCDTYTEAGTEKELQAVFDDAREHGLEGIVVKNPDAEYMAGARSFTWVKLKIADVDLLDDTVDAVVLGYYYGKGVRAKFGIGGFLVGIYDNESDEYKTITKIGTGLKDDDWIKLKELADKTKLAEKPKNYDISKMYACDVWTYPKIVVEVGADEVSKSAEHSTGFALRFPRLIRFREDKSPTDTTALSEIKDLHAMKKRAYY